MSLGAPPAISGEAVELLAKAPRAVALKSLLSYNQRTTITPS